MKRTNFSRALGAVAMVALIACGQATDPTLGTQAVAASGLDPAPTIGITSPTSNSNIPAEPGGVDITMTVTVAGTTVGGSGPKIHYLLNGALIAEATTTAAQVFPAVPPGRHQLSARLVTATGLPLDNAKSLKSIYIKVIAACATVADCADGNTCSNEGCSKGKCAYGPKGSCCDSDLECAYGTFCEDNKCRECLDDTHCEDGNACTTNACNTNGICVATVNPGCCSVDSDCNDSDACTDDICGGGTCTNIDNGDPLCCNTTDDCSPPNACQQRLCYKSLSLDHPICRYGPPVQGCCEDNAGCFDGNACTTDSCDLSGGDETGVCAFDTISACCLSDSDCDDADPATSDTCDSNACTHEAEPNFCPLPDTSALVINEFMAWPGAVSDATGEWIEVYNATESPINLLGWTINGHQITVGGSTGQGTWIVSPGAYAVLAAGAKATNGGFVPNYVYGNALSIGDPNSGGLPTTLQLKNSSGTLVDEVLIDGSFPIAEGVTTQLKNPYIDNNLAASWTLAGQHVSASKNTQYGAPATKMVGSPKSINRSSFQGVLSPVACIPPAGASVCAEGRCGLDSQCFFPNAEDCCEVDSDCNDGQSCTTDTCDTGSNTCNAGIPVANCCEADADCDDGNPCNLDRCVAKSCRHSPDTVPNCCAGDGQCEDGDACTTNVCDMGSNTCNAAVTVVPPVGATCCNGPGDCDDGDPATLDTCDPAVDLCDFPTDADYCDDAGDLCDDGDDCTTDICDVAANNCNHTATEGCCTLDDDCDGGGACAVGSCDAGTCAYIGIPGCCTKPQDCDDGDVCTADVCNEGNCQAVPVEGCCLGDAECDDALSCTTDSCVGNSCVNDQGSNNCCVPGSTSGELEAQCGPDPDGADACFSWGCDVTGACQLVEAAECCTDASDCTDASVCTIDICGANGLCKHLTDTGGSGCCDSEGDCAPGEYCHPADKTCGAPLPNGDACTADVQCVSGWCDVDGTGTCQDPQGDGAACGSDAACAGGSCTDGGLCCTATCAGAVCGDDGCGGSCGECNIDQVCGTGACEFNYVETGPTAYGHTIDGVMTDYPTADHEWSDITSLALTSGDLYGDFIGGSFQTLIDWTTCTTPLLPSDGVLVTMVTPAGHWLIKVLAGGGVTALLDGVDVSDDGLVMAALGMGGSTGLPGAHAQVEISLPTSAGAFEFMIESIGDTCEFETEEIVTGTCKPGTGIKYAPIFATPTPAGPRVRRIRAGSPVAIQGIGLGDIVSVTVGGVTATITGKGAKTIVIQLPGGIAPGPQSVVMTRGNGTVHPPVMITVVTDVSGGGMVQRNRNTTTKDGSFTGWTPGATQYEYWSITPMRTKRAHHCVHQEQTSTCFVVDWNGGAFADHDEIHLYGITDDGRQLKITANQAGSVVATLDGTVMTGVEAGISEGLSPWESDTAHPTLEVCLPTIFQALTFAAAGPCADAPGSLCHDEGALDVQFDGAGTATVVPTTAPRLLYSDPANEAAVGATITLIGSNLGDGTGHKLVFGGGIEATPTSWTNDTIVVDIPAGATSGEVAIQDGSGNVLSNGFGFVVPGTDGDGDGVLDENDNCPLLSNADQFDGDGDGVGDLCDGDIDGDGTPNEADTCQSFSGGVGGNADPDGDNIGSDCDVCPTIYDPAQADQDADEIGDACDGDIDGDGAPNEYDNCPNIDNADQANVDGDSFGNPCDNCPTVTNQDQLDTDENDTGDACEGLYVVPWTESFDGPGPFSLYGFATTTDAGSPENDWGLTTHGTLGPDTHARFSYAPLVTSFSEFLLGPKVDASAVTKVTLGFNCHLLVDTPLGVVLIEALVSGDNGATWTTVWNWSTDQGDIAPTEITVDATSILAGQDDARVAFRVSGDSSFDLLYWDIDDVRLIDGLAPTLNPVANQNVATGETTPIALSATDGDTPGNGLTFAMDVGPSWATLNDNGDGTANVALLPTVLNQGVHTITVSVTDGTFTKRRTFEITALPPGEGGGGDPDPIGEPLPAPEAAFIIVRDAAGGAGNAIGDLTLVQGQSLTGYAAGYNIDLEYVSDINVIWSTTGGLPAVFPGPATSATLIASGNGAAGYLKATHPHPSAVGDSTGIITIPIPPPGAPNGAQSTLSASKSAIKATGIDTVKLTVTVLDSAGIKVTAPATVVFSTTLGTLLGSVTNNGDGTYSQVMESTLVPGTATISATVDGDAVGNTVSMPIVPIIDLVGDGIPTIDCDNYGTYAGENLVIAGGTVRINSYPCAPMIFGHVTIGAGGVLTHTAPAVDSIQGIDIEVKSLTIEPTGSVALNGVGYAKDRGYGNQTAFGQGGNTGGSHGGRGGRANNNATHAVTYGDVRNPRYPGGGGNANGGGLFRCTVTAPNGRVAIHGTITANGNNNSYGGGAGGGIYINAPFIAGAGTINAFGGTGHTSYPYYSGGGGGGRVALIASQAFGQGFTPLAVHNNVDLHGGSGWNRGGAGTLLMHGPGSIWGTLIADNKGAAAPKNSTPFVDIGTGISEAVTDTTLTDADLFMEPDFYAGSLMTPKRNDGTITVSDADIFKIHANDRDTFTTDSGVGAGAVAGDEWSGIHVFDQLEIRGGAWVSAESDLLVLGGDLSSGDIETFAMNGGMSARVLDLGAATQVTGTGGGMDAQWVVGQSDELFAMDYIFTNSVVTMGDLIATEIDMVGGSLTVDTLTASGNVVLEGTATTVKAELFDVAGALDLFGTASFTHPATSATVVHKLDITAGTFTLASTATVELDGLGFLGKYGAGNSTDLGSKGKSGGSGGGLGATGSAAGDPGPVVSDLYRPTLPGGGAASSAKGGGVLKMTIAGTAVIDGVVSADGNPNNYGGGGGGSVWLDVKTLTGTGTISVKGGTASTAYPYYGGGGGGGRVALWVNAFSGGFSPASVRDRLQLQGGGGWHKGGTGTAYMNSATSVYGDLVVDARGVIPTAYASTPLHGAFGGSIDALSAQTLTTGGASLPTSPSLAGTPINVDAGSGDALSLADDPVFTTTSNDTTTVSFDAETDLTTATALGQTWRTLYRFDRLEVGGGARIGTDGDILVTDGDIRNFDPTHLVIDGHITANTLDIQGVTTFTVNDGGLALTNLWAGSDETPEIAIALTNSVTTIPNLYGATVSINGGTATFGTLTATTTLDLLGSAIVTISDSAVSAGMAIELAGTSKLRHSTSTAAVAYDLHLTAPEVTIGSSAEIDVGGRGYLAKYGLGNISGAGAGNKFGGSHGGRGGRGNATSNRPDPYGSLHTPTTHGSGGWTSAGGGVVRIDAPIRLAHDGLIKASGSAGAYGAGAGGSIWLNAGAVTGTGTLDLQGGVGNTGYPYYSGGGGGGRAALYTTGLRSADWQEAALLARVIIHGGNGWNDGGAGTFFSKEASQSYGDLYVDNAGHTADLDSTPMTSVGRGTLTGYDGATLEDSTSLWGINAKVGDSVTPHEVGTDALSLFDNVISTVVANDATTLTLDPPLVGDEATAGDAYASLYLFDNLEISGNAKVFTAGHIGVLSGDLGSNDDTTFHMGGRLRAHTLDLNGVTTIRSNGQGGYDVTTLLGSGASDYAFDYILTGGTFDAATLTAETLSASGTALNIDSIVVNGDATFAGATYTFSDILVGGVLTLNSGAIFKHPPTDATGVKTLEILADSLVIADGGMIDVSNLGYLSRTSVGGDGTYGTGNKCGGGHGGLGGQGNVACVLGPAYDPIDHPSLPGAGGGGSGASTGGGVVIIDVAGAITINGEIRANGQASVYGAAGGGTVKITADELTGSGTIKAIGGNASAGYPYYSGGGGGGRVAIHADRDPTSAFKDTSVGDAIWANGGTGWKGGGAGTIYLVSDEGTNYGALLVSNRDVVAVNGSTPIVLAGPGTIDALTATELTDISAASLPILNRLAGTYISPKMVQGDAGTLIDDDYFKIDAFAATTLTTAGDMSTAGAPGDTYRGLLVLDDLQILRKARVDIQGDVIVVGGDLVSEDFTTFNIDGSLTADRIELFGVTDIGVEEGTFNYDELMSNGVDDYPFTWILTGGTVTTDTMTADTIDSTTGFVNVTTLDVVDYIQQSGGTFTAQSVNVGGDYELVSDAKLTHPAGTATNWYRLDVLADRLVVGTGASVDVSGRGFIAGRTIGNAATGAAGSRNGGAHAGYGGGANLGTTPGVVYGSYKEPYHPGGGGGGAASGGDGGGAVYLLLTELDVDGSIFANGADATYGGGAGGSIHIEADILSGTGTIQAIGGGANPSYPYYAGGGSGGRVAFTGHSTVSGSFAEATVGTKVNAGGGNGWRDGAAGTFFRKSTTDTHGHLIVDGKTNAPGAGALTPLTTIGYGIVDSLDGARTVESFGAAWFTASMAGLTAVLDFDSGTLTDLLGLTTYAVVSNTDSAMTFGEDIDGVTIDGFEYVGLVELDTLQISGGARVTVEDAALLVHSGDDQGTATDFDTGTGTLTGAWIDLQAIVFAEISGTVTGTTDLFCSGCP